MKWSIACAGLFVFLGFIGLSLSFAQPSVKQTSSAAEMTVTTQVFHGSDREPLSSHTILFDQETIYAIPNSDQEPITVIDQQRNRVQLIDRARQTRTAIGTKDLLSMTAQLRASATSDAIRERLGINAKVIADADSGVYSVAYGGIEYSTTTQKLIQPDAALKFGRFSDWASRLNLARQVGMPPFGRMQMNSQIASDGRMPLETTLRFQQGETSEQYRSTHVVTTSISDKDRQRIDEIAAMLALYKDVPFAEFAK